MERPRYRPRLVATGAAIAALVVAVFGVAAGQAQTQPQMQIQPTSGLPGSAATVSSVTPCTGEITVADGPPTGTYATLGTTSSTGSWSVPITIPASAATGPFLVHAWCDTPTQTSGSSSSTSSSLAIAATGGRGPQATTASRRAPDALVPTVRTVYAPVTFTVTSSSSSSSSSTSSSSTTSTTLRPPTMQLSSTTVVQGGKVTVTTQGWQPGSTVQVWLRSDPVFAGSAIADQAGSAVVEISVPSDFPTGAHQVVMTGIGLGGVAAEIAADLTVTSLGGAAAAAFESPGLGAAAASASGSGSGSTGTTGSSGTLPSTGTDRVVPLTVLALGLIAAGSALVAVRRRLG